MEFVKMQGLGNDFVVLAGPAAPAPTEVARLCDRRWGIGADGVLVASRVDPATVRMQYWNADGSAAELCGNGLRCVARFAVEAGWIEGGSFVVETAVGPRHVEVGPDRVRAELGPVVASGEVHVLAGYEMASVSVGNPHAVGFVDDCYSVPVEVLGPVIEGDPTYPGRTNVEFATVVAPDRIALRVWERGVGETLACGTGAAAAAAEAYRSGLTGPSVTVVLPGGELRVEIIDGVGWITGPAEIVYRGTI